MGGNSGVWRSRWLRSCPGRLQYPAAARVLPEMGYCIFIFWDCLPQRFYSKRLEKHIRREHETILIHRAPTHFPSIAATCHSQGKLPKSVSAACSTVILRLPTTCGKVSAIKMKQAWLQVCLRALEHSLKTLTGVLALTALRNQFTIKYEANISANDERLLLAKDWLESEPGAQDLFEIWGKTSTVRDLFTRLMHRSYTLV